LIFLGGQAGLKVTKITVTIGNVFSRNTLSFLDLIRIEKKVRYDFNKNKKDRLWGFVTQMPNWKWLITRFFLPALLAFGLFFYLGRRAGYNTNPNK